MISLRLVFIVIGALAHTLYAMGNQSVLTPRATEVPFAYKTKGSRTWPLLLRPLAANEQVMLTAKLEGQTFASKLNAQLEVGHVRVTVNRQGKLEVVSADGSPAPTFDIDVEILTDGQPSERQTITLRPAPPTRPVTYYADFGDDLVYIFGAGVRGTTQSAAGAPPANLYGHMTRTPEGVAQYDKAGFDQYFRRLQNQGVAHEILWMFPFAFVSDASAFDPRDWDLYQRHARALIHDERLAKLTSEPVAAREVLHWFWVRDLMAFRLDPDAHRALSQSAIEHGITLGVSYRPFEQAVSKSYEMPVFDASGEFLWSFQPLSSPTVNFRGSEVGFMHYREVLAAMGQSALGHVGEIRLRAVGNRDEFLARFRDRKDNLQVVVSNVPPLQADSFVLVRQADGEFRLTPFNEISAKAQARRRIVRNFRVKVDSADGLIVSDLDIPHEYRFILLENPSGDAPLTVEAGDPVRLVSKAGTPLGRNAVFLSLSGKSAEEKATRVAGMTANIRLHAPFAAAEGSQKYLLKAGTRQPLAQSTIVIDRGEPFSREMVDFEQPSARASVVREIRAILKYPAFQEIYLNTRSHTSLTVSTGDGADGVRPVVHYMATKKPYTRLSIDLAYAPRRAVSDPSIRSLANPNDIAVLTEFHSGEWAGTCQSPGSERVWRLTRNQGVAAGVRLLLQDLERAFPQHRLRVVVPEGEAVDRAVSSVVTELPANALNYKRSRNNYIQNIGEGLALLDLSGLRTEPVLLGIGPFVDERILKTYLDAELAALKGNRGADFQGPRGIMYEGQWTLKPESGRRARETVMRTLLARRGEIGEVIVYEAAEWAYRLPWDGFEFLAAPASQ